MMSWLQSWGFGFKPRLREKTSSCCYSADAVRRHFPFILSLWSHLCFPLTYLVSLNAVLDINCQNMMNLDLCFQSKLKPYFLLQISKLLWLKTKEHGVTSTLKWCCDGWGTEFFVTWHLSTRWTWRDLRQRSSGVLLQRHLSLIVQVCHPCFHLNLFYCVCCEGSKTWIWNFWSVSPIYSYLAVDGVTNPSFISFVQILTSQKLFTIA